LIVLLQLLPVLWLPSLHTWDNRYPLLIGNEVGGGRPWLGEIRRLAIYDRALSKGEIRDLSDRAVAGSPSPSVETIEPLISYTPTEGTLQPRSTVLPESAAALAAENPAAIAIVPGEGLALRLPTVVATKGPFAELTDALSGAAGFTVEVVCRPASLDQQGPARIVSLSGGVLERNFTLAQWDRVLIFRVRSPLSGPNGTRRELRAGGLSNENFQHLVATYDRGAARIFIDGLERPERVETPDLADLGRGAIALVILAALPFAIAGVGLMGGAGVVEGTCRVMAAWLLVSALAWAIRALTTGHPPDFAASLSLALALAVLAPVVQRLCRA
jgi:hypothetical protein